MGLIARWSASRSACSSRWAQLATQRARRRPPQRLPGVAPTHGHRQPRRRRRHHRGVLAGFRQRRASRVPPVAAIRDVAFDTSASSPQPRDQPAPLLALGVLCPSPAWRRAVEKRRPSRPRRALPVGAATCSVPSRDRSPAARRTAARFAASAVARPRERCAQPAAHGSDGGCAYGGRRHRRVHPVLAASVKQSITDITQPAEGRLLINTTTGGFGNSVGFSPDLATNVNTLPEVQSVSGIASVR